MSVMAERPVRHLRVPTIGQARWTKVALACGVAASLLYFAMDAVAAALYDGYSYTGQTISELSAIGAPTRSMWILLGSLYAMLMIAFGLGVWLAAGRKLALRIAAVMATLVGVVGLVGWPFAPMH